MNKKETKHLILDLEDNTDTLIYLSILQIIVEFNTFIPKKVQE